VLGGAQATVV